MKGVGMLAVSLMGVNYAFWYPLGCRQYFKLSQVLLHAKKIITRKTSILGPVYTSPDELLLHGQILYLDRLFTWDHANSVTDCSSVYTGPWKFETSHGI